MNECTIAAPVEVRLPEPTGLARRCRAWPASHPGRGASRGGRPIGPCSPARPPAPPRDLHQGRWEQKIRAWRPVGVPDPRSSSRTRRKRLWFSVPRSVMPRINHFPPFPVSVASSPTRGWPTATGTQPATSLEAGRPDAGVSGAGLLPGARRKNPSCLVHLSESSGLPGLVAAAGQPVLCPHMASSACLSSLTGTSSWGIRATLNPHLH